MPCKVLPGLENIHPALIGNLTIKENDLLFSCEIQNICDYLASPSGTVSIQNNAPGCNSPEEVQDACDSITSVPELIPDHTFTIIPNPLESSTIIKYNLCNDSPVLLKILDVSGREIKTLVNQVQNQGEQRVVFNAVGLKPGIYFSVLKINDGIQTKKIIKL